MGHKFIGATLCNEYSFLEVCLSIQHRLLEEVVTMDTENCLEENSWCEWNAKSFRANNADDDLHNIFFYCSFILLHCLLHWLSYGCLTCHNACEWMSMKKMLSDELLSVPDLPVKSAGCLSSTRFAYSITAKIASAFATNISIISLLLGFFT